MKAKTVKLIIICAIPAILIAGVCVWRPSSQIMNDRAIDVETSKMPVETLIPVNYNWPMFYAAIGRHPSQDNPAGSYVLGAIVPHHDLAADYTAELFQRIGRRDIRTIIIVGPNHENSGAGDIITGSVAYGLLRSQVHSSSTLVARILEDKVAVSDTDRLKTEHSIYNIVPYVDYYFPQAEIVPIILSGRVTREQAESLGKYLAGHLDKKTLIIGSIDFSHYLATEKARANDLVTRAALTGHDYEKLFSFNNDYIDSPQTAVTVLTAAKIAGAPTVDIVRNANQADATGVSSVLSSTSYFTVLMRR